MFKVISSSNNVLLYCIIIIIIIIITQESRLKVLDIMDECQSSPRPLLKENGPVHGQ